LPPALPALTLGLFPYHDRERRGHVFQELTSELLDLTATEKGFRTAMYAAVEGEQGCSSSCSGCSTTILCCSIHICW
jgi:hypothetical protein